jgi:cytochrome c oxidase cbb3-type subunit 2
MNARLFALAVAISSFVFVAIALATQAAPAARASERDSELTAVVRTDLGELKWMRTHGTDYTPLQRYGRHIFLRERCWLCHSESVRFETNETRRGGPVGEAGEFAYDGPRLANSGRVGPDLTRVGLKYSDEWHFAHFWNPRQLSLTRGPRPASPLSAAASWPREELPEGCERQSGRSSCHIKNI